MQTVTCEMENGNLDGRQIFLGYDMPEALGIIGLGEIGTLVAKRARGFDMEVIYYSKTRKRGIESEWI